MADQPDPLTPELVAEVFDLLERSPLRGDEIEFVKDGIYHHVKNGVLIESHLVMRRTQMAEQLSKYHPKTLEQKLGYLVEECGEVLAAVGKTQRWGLDSVNPEIPAAERETNRDWILRELHDLERAIGFVREAIK